MNLFFGNTYPSKYGRTQVGTYERKLLEFSESSKIDVHIGIDNYFSQICLSVHIINQHLPSSCYLIFNLHIPEFTVNLKQEFISSSRGSATINRSDYNPPLTAQIPQPVVNRRSHRERVQYTLCTWASVTINEIIYDGIKKVILVSLIIIAIHAQITSSINNYITFEYLHPVVNICSQCLCICEVVYHSLLSSILYF